MKKIQKAKTTKKITTSDPIQEIFCLTCNEKFQTKMKNTFYNFIKYQCPKCKTKNTYPIDEILCLSCNEKIKAKPNTTLLGFTQYQCPNCDKKSTYPLTQNNYRSCITVIVICIIFAIISPLTGFYLVPGILVIISIMSDFDAQMNVKKAVKRYNLSHPDEEKIELK